MLSPLQTHATILFTSTIKKKSPENSRFSGQSGQTLTLTQDANGCGQHGKRSLFHRMEQKKVERGPPRLLVVVSRICKIHAFENNFEKYFLFFLKIKK